MTLTFKGEAPGTVAPDRVVDVEPIFVSVLEEGGWDPSTGTQGTGPLPATRVTFIGDRAPNDPWTDAVAQIDVWADSPDAAGAEAASIATFWGTILRGDVDDAYISGAWIVTEPRSFPDPATDVPRYLMEVALRIHPKESADG